MGATKHSLDSIDIGNGVIATDVWIADTPLPVVLIQAKIKNGIPMKSRLDLQKRMFIDPVPAQPSIDGMRALVAAVVGVSQPTKRFA